MSELSDEASEPELLNRSLSMWHGLGTQVSGEELDVPLDLHTAASIGQYEVVKECVQREPICGFTPLMEAAAAGHEIIVQYFLNHGVKVDARDHSGATARMLAKQYGHMKIVALMDTYSPSLPKSLYRSPEKYEDLSSSDESCPAPQRQRPCRKKGVSIHEGPRALARITGIGLGGRAPRPRYEQAPPRGYVTFNSSGENPLEEEGLCCRDVTSPINERDVESSSSSSSREEHAFCANLGPVQSSSSSEGLARAQGLSSEASVESNEDSDHACKSSARKQAKSYMKTKNPDSQWPPRAATDREGFLAESSPQTQRAPYSGPQDLAALLEQIGCLKYLQVFEEQDVDLRIFLTLTESDLKEIGITLFGPKRKMTSAIARWHSSARPPGDALELAYADRLEAEMQELAIQLHKRCEEVEATRGQVCQEQELRAVVESCLLEQDRAREDLQARLRETWALARDAALVLDQLRACQAELSSRVRQDQPPGAATLGLAVPPADSKGWQASLQAMSLPELSGALEDRVREMGQALCLVTQSLEKLQVLNGKKWRET
ncbi:ankyrin repeat and SAM domain-containing protein 3 isoform 2 [Homo sapiens]|uniref:Ankyrin repeat and sterile alpha motif domain containing 3 n=4 Tax=Homo sapiens TaxID=9606 RepID=F6WF08_HUMAN|nr:ankyrin repeat and SAM domain-containing protein 3 isoform 2 [Homo sapiens]|eukprot:NP_001229858.1 ankyrin repeat and SAM domain-containing protein 3 isoform 2 [Homo sapiens]